MATRWQIGDHVWRAGFEASVAHVICPDCCGSGRLRVIMGDETEVSIDCRNCESGWKGPQGRIQVYDRAPSATLVCINGIRLEADKTEYQTTASYSDTEENLFDSEADAVIAAQVLADRLGKEELLLRFY